MKANENEKQRGLKRAEVREQQGGCFNGEARVLLADGSVKEAHQVHVGDCIACDIDCATSAVVIGRYVQSAGVRREVTPSLQWQACYIQFTPREAVRSLDDAWRCG